MCQLLGMNCNVPTDICFSFTGFQARGGGTDVHKDGWGIAFFEGKGVRLFLDPLPSAQSPIAEMVRQYPIKSTNVIAHIRKATRGEVSLENTHPFGRELWGYHWIFAHNGTLPDFDPALSGIYCPAGSTDSERAFCFMLQSLRDRFGSKRPDDASLFGSITEITKQLGALGPFNFLFSNGEMLFAHCSTKLSFVIRRAPFSQARLKDRDVSVDLSQVTTPKDQVAVIATVPLTEGENWTELEPGTLLMFKDGDVVSQAKTVAGKESAEAPCPT